MSGEMAYYHDNTAIVLSRLQCAEFSRNQTRPWLLFSIRNNCNKLPIFHEPLFTTKIEFTCSLKLRDRKSMRRHRLSSPAVQSASKYSKGIYIIHELQVHARPAARPRLLNGWTALHHGRTRPVILTWQSLSPKDWDSFEIFNNALRIREKSANYVHTDTLSFCFSLTHTHTNTHKYKLEGVIKDFALWRAVMMLGFLWMKNERAFGFGLWWHVIPPSSVHVRDVTRNSETKRWRLVVCMRFPQCSRQ